MSLNLETTPQGQSIVRFTALDNVPCSLAQTTSVPSEVLYLGPDAEGQHSIEGDSIIIAGLYSAINGYLDRYNGVAGAYNGYGYFVVDSNGQEVQLVYSFSQSENLSISATDIRGDGVTWKVHVDAATATDLLPFIVNFLERGSITASPSDSQTPAQAESRSPEQASANESPAPVEPVQPTESAATSDTASPPVQE